MAVKLFEKPHEIAECIPMKLFEVTDITERMLHTYSNT